MKNKQNRQRDDHRNNDWRTCWHTSWKNVNEAGKAGFTTTKKETIEKKKQKAFCIISVSIVLCCVVLWKSPRERERERDGEKIEWEREGENNNIKKMAIIDKDTMTMETDMTITTQKDEENKILPINPNPYYQN